ncbi:VTT domain-containing protein [Reyranella sp.]|uniref:VTT domain-containing protein n=1 Tax=Reyranella sp. TaxID=1929291 RepID=UPI003BA84B03
MTILRPDQTVWRKERASRAAVLVDGANFYAAARAAFLKAQRRILIVGWDIDSRTRLVGAAGEPDDGLPAGVADFLSALVERRPELEVHLLLWDYSLLYAGERELLPRLSLGWQTPERITLCLDNTVPLGSSQHQKIIVVDDAVAMSGGLDLTIRRWDTSAHDAINPHRVDPAGEPYRPFHDVQMMVDGDAARALAELARERWCRANGDRPAIEPCGDPWPDAVHPQFEDVEIGIARTQPRYNGDEAVREVETLFVESIARAERTIYIENQFLSAPLVADRLAQRLRERPQLELVMVAPRSHDSWVERRTMRNGRIRFWRRVHGAGGDRVRLLYPAVEQEGKKTDTMIHSKVMVVDDWFLRVGSANLNNRSMGADTECDLAIEARTDRDRSAIVGMRNRLLGEHCGVGAEQVAEALSVHGSLVRAALELGDRGHRLRPIDDGEPDEDTVSRLVEKVADPARPLRIPRLLRHLVGRFVPGRALMAAAAAALFIIGLALAWKFTSLSEVADPARIGQFLAAGRDEPWAVAMVVLVFVLAGAMVFPLNILVLATAATFGPWLGMAYSAVGALASAVLMFLVGSLIGRDALARLLGQRWKRAIEGVRSRGLLTVITLRIVPVAPFTLVNLAAGAAGISLVDFVAGSLIGLAPGLALLSFVGDRIVRAVTDPSLGEISVLVLCIVAYLALAFGAQFLLSQRRGRAS